MNIVDTTYMHIPTYTHRCAQMQQAHTDTSTTNMVAEQALMQSAENLMNTKINEVKVENGSRD